MQRVVKAALDAPRLSSGAPWLLTLGALVCAAVVYTGVGRSAEPEAFRIVGDHNGVTLVQWGTTPASQTPSEEPGSIMIVLTPGGDSEQNP